MKSPFIEEAIDLSVVYVTVFVCQGIDYLFFNRMTMRWFMSEIIAGLRDMKFYLQSISLIEMTTRGSISLTFENR